MDKTQSEFCYKPSLDVAIETITNKARRFSKVQEVDVHNALFCTVARDIASPVDAPPVTWARKDGTAVGESGGRPFTVDVRTGEPVPEGTQAVIPSENYDKATARKQMEAAVARGRLELVVPGSEYAKGEALLHKGDVFDLPAQSQMQYLDIYSAVALVQPALDILVFSDQPPSSIPAATWLSNFARSWGFKDIRTTLVKSVAKIPTHLSPRSLVVALSDGAPGRYAEMSPLWNPSQPNVELDFWKWQLYPCRHVGFGTLDGHPLLILPDVFSKTVLSSLVFFPAWCQAPLDMPLHEQSFELSPEIPLESGYPRMVPVEVRPTPSGLNARQCSLLEAFSGKGVLRANGYALVSEEEKNSSSITVTRALRGRW